MKKLLLIALTGLSLSVTGAASAAGDAAAGKAKSPVCASCHGLDGNSVNPEWPSLAGQGAGYLVKQLQDFHGDAANKNPARTNTMMSPQAAGLSEQDMQDLAAYFSSQVTKPGKADESKVALGEKIFRGGNASSGVAACAACHGPTGAGNPAAKFPKLAGQHSKYIAIQLRNFRSGARSNDAGAMMRNIASKMTDNEIDSVAEYIAGLHD